MPRQNERVPAGAVFAPFEFVYSLYDLNGAGYQGDIEWLQSVFTAMEMLEDDYLGGYGSRGAGKFVFRNIAVTFKSPAYYEGSADSAVVLVENVTVAQLRTADYTARINKALEG